MTPSLIGRRTFLAAATRGTAAQRQFTSTSIRAASATVASRQQQQQYHGSSTDRSKYGMLAAAAGLLASGALTERADTSSSAKCCGIAGVVGAKGDARDYLVEGLTILKNRGYDSAGIATMDENNPSLVSLALFCMMYDSCVYIIDQPLQKVA